MALRLCVDRECIGYVRIEGSPRLARRERRAEGKHIVLRTQEIAHPNSKKKPHGSKEKHYGSTSHGRVSSSITGPWPIRFGAPFD